MLKNIIYYILSIISIYISYLVCRIFDFKIAGQIVIYIVNFAISIWAIFKIKRNIDFSVIKKKKNIIYLFISGVVSIVIVCNCNFFSKGYVESKTEIYSDYPIEKSIIEKIIYNNTVNTIKDDGLVYDKAGELNNKIHINIINQNRINITMEKNFKSAVKLRGNNDKLYYKDNGNIKKVESELICIESNTVKDQLYCLRGILSFLAIIYIVCILILYIVQNKKRISLVFTMLVVGLIGLGYFLNLRLGIVFNDTKGYTNFNFNEFIHGIFHGRTPGYPLVIRLCTKLFGDSNMLLTVCMVQYIVWFVSIIYLFKLLKLLTKNNKISCVVSVLYALCPGILGWNNSILTESLALSLTCIFVYHIVNYIKTLKLTSGFYSVIIAFILTFIRPTSLIYVCFLEIFWLARFIFERKNIKKDIKCFIASTISIILIGIYAIIFHNTFGIYSISDAMVRQDLFVCIQQGYYKDSDNAKFIEDVEEGKKEFPDVPWNGMVYVLNKYSLNDMQKITNYCRMQNMDKYMKYILNLIKVHTSVHFNAYGFEFLYIGAWLEKVVRRIFSFITFLYVYGVITINGILVIYKWIIDKKVPWIYFGLFCFPTAIVLSSFIGTCAEWMRTAQCVLPFTYISLAVYVSLIIKEKEVNYDRVIEEK